MNLLIVDDEGMIRRMVYSQLMEMNLGMERIDTADSSREARARMAEYMYDIILCDIVMPEENGIQFAKWVLERHPQIKFIFLTAYADINYMKEAISMQSFDYVLQPISSEELRGVVERAITQIKIEKKNQELISQGRFFAEREDTILDARVIRYLEGKKEDSGYLQRLITKNSIYAPEDCVYMPVLVQVQKSQKKLEEIEHPLMRSIYQNILSELFESLLVSEIVLLEEEENDFFVLMYWQRKRAYTVEKILERLESFRVLFYKLLQTQIAVYCGDICEAENLAEKSRPLFSALKNNVRRGSRVFHISETEDSIPSRSFEVQIKTWKKLLDEKQFFSFKESILYYIREGSTQSSMNADTMIKMHQQITELLLVYLVNHQISSDMIFDKSLPYLTYMTSWQDLDKFERALTHITKKMQESSGVPDNRNAVEEATNYIRQNLDRELSVAEIADHVGMNREYCTKLFKKSTGYNLKEYIVNEKMKAAKTLLSTTELPITLISSHAGYGNYSNFTRSFKQITGMTPLEYRKQK